MTDDIKPGDIVSYDGDIRVLARYVGFDSKGLAVVESFNRRGLTVWLPGKMRLYRRGDGA